MARVTKQIHIPKSAWDTFDKRVGDRCRSSGTEALYRALAAGDVPTFDKHHADIRAEIVAEQSKRLSENRAK